MEIWRIMEGVEKLCYDDRTSFQLTFSDERSNADSTTAKFAELSSHLLERVTFCISCVILVMDP